MTKEKTTLTAEQSRLVQLLVAGKTQQEIADSLGISVRTVARWQELPQVVEALTEIQQNIGIHVRKQIEALSTRAIEALEESLSSDSSLAKVQAIKIVLDRLDPEILKVAQQVQEVVQPSIVDPSLLGYLEDHEIKTIDEIMERARARKQEAEEKITPMRRQA